MNNKLDNLKWALIVSSPIWAMFTITVLAYGLQQFWYVQPICALLIMAIVFFTGKRKKWKEVKYEDLTPEQQKEIDSIEQKIKDCGGTIVSRKIEDDEE